MGKKYVPSFAIIFMANLADEVLRKAKCKPLVMFRFIDDLFSFGPIQKMNSQSLSIYLTATTSRSK